jgi:hypothetical protein
MSVDLVCVQCRSVFRARRHAQFCSDRCRKRSSRVRTAQPPRPDTFADNSDTIVSETVAGVDIVDELLAERAGRRMAAGLRP